MDKMIKCQYAKVSNDYDLVILRLKFVSFEETEEFLQRIVLVDFSSCLSSYGSQYNMLPQRLGPIKTYFNHIVSYCARANSCSTFANSCWKQYPRVGLRRICVESFETYNFFFFSIFDTWCQK